MEITARLVRNAAVKTMKSGKELVTFSVAMNDSYKAKGSSEVTKIVTYLECEYWRNMGIAPYLTKGSIVTLSGRIGVNVWTNMDGEAKGQLTFTVNDIKLLGGGTKSGNSAASQKADTDKIAVTTSADENDDLPF